MDQKLLSYDSQFEDIRQALADYQGQNDKLQILGETEIDQSKVKDTRQLMRELQRQSTDIKDSIIKLEKLSRGVEQRNKTKKLRDLYQKEYDRFQSNQKLIFSECTEQIREQLKEQPPKEKVIKPKQDLQNANKVEIYYEKFSENGQVIDKGYKDDLETIDWENQIIKEKQQDIDHIHQKAYDLQQAVTNLALETDNQDKFFDVITQNLDKAQDNIKGTQKELVETSKEQKKSTKKYLLMFLCLLIVVGLFIGLIILVT